MLKRVINVVMWMLFASWIADTQVAPSTGIAFGNNQGTAVLLSGATVQVCTTPTSKSPPCDTPATIYLVGSDGNCLGTAVVSGQLTTGTNGTYAFCALPGTYAIESTSAYFGLVRSYGVIGGGGSGGLGLLSSSNTWNGNNTFTQPLTIGSTPTRKITISAPSTLTADYVQTLQAASGTVALTTQIPKLSAYTVAPFGAPWTADYMCGVSDCSTAFSAALTATQTSVAGAKGGKIKVLAGLYPFTSPVAVCDLDSIVIEGDSPMGMWATGGTVFAQNANVELFSLCRTASTPKAITFRGIHFLNNVGATSAMIHSVNGFNIEIDHNYFELANPAIIAERAWDWWITGNNFRDCGTDSTTHACVVFANATVASDGVSHLVGGNGSGAILTGNRFETRPGASFYFQPSSTYNFLNVHIADSKFEGTTGVGAPIVTGSLQSSTIVANHSYYATTSHILLDLNSNGNVINDNVFMEAQGTDISLAGNTNSVQGNVFQYPGGSNPAHVTLLTGAYGNRVQGNTKTPSDTVPLLSDSGTATIPDSINPSSSTPIVFAVAPQSTTVQRISGADLNTVLACGEYDGNNLVNGPPLLGTSFGKIKVECSHDSAFLTQTVFAMTSGGDYSWQRRQEIGIWYAWYQTWPLPTGYTGTVTCTAGQHINALTVVNGIITVAPTCN